MSRIVRVDRPPILRAVFSSFRSRKRQHWPGFYGVEYSVDTSTWFADDDRDCTQSEFCSWLGLERQFKALGGTTRTRNQSF